GAWAGRGSRRPRQALDRGGADRRTVHRADRDQCFERPRSTGRRSSGGRGTVRRDDRRDRRMKPAASLHLDGLADPRANTRDAADRGRAVRRYRRLAKVFHWLTAALVLAPVPFGAVMQPFGALRLAD